HKSSVCAQGSGSGQLAEHASQHAPYSRGRVLSQVASINIYAVYCAEAVLRRPGIRQQDLEGATQSERCQAPLEARCAVICVSTRNCCDCEPLLGPALLICAHSFESSPV